MSVMYAGLALNGDGNLVVIDNGGNWPPNMVTFTQDGRLLLSTPFLPLMFCENPERAKCRFVHCVGNTVFVSDLGIYHYCCIYYHNLRIGLDWIGLDWIGLD